MAARAIALAVAAAHIRGRAPRGDAAEPWGEDRAAFADPDIGCAGARRRRHRRFSGRRRLARRPEDRGAGRYAAREAAAVDSRSPIARRAPPVIKRAIEHAPPIGNALAAHEGIFGKITGVVSLAFDVGIEAASVIAPAPIWPRSRRSTSLECHGSSRPRIGGVYAIFSTSSEQQRWAGGSLASRSRWRLSEC